MEPWSEEAADLYELIFRSDDIPEHARRLHGIIQARVSGAHTLLDVACGTGWHLEQLARWYEVEGVDLSPAMLARAATRLPGVPLHVADMRDFELAKRFDAVICLSSSIAYMLTLDDLRKATSNMVRHLQPEGVVIVEPWDDPEEAASKDIAWAAMAEEPGRKVVLMETTRLAGRVWVQDSHFLIGTADGVRHLSERTELGAFTRKDMVSALQGVELRVDYEDDGLIGRGLYVGVREGV